MVVKCKFPSMLCAKFKFKLFDLRLWELEIEHFKFLLSVNFLDGSVLDSQNI